MGVSPYGTGVDSSVDGLKRLRPTAKLFADSLMRDIFFRTAAAHQIIGDYRTVGRYRTVASDLWRPSPIVADSPIAAKVHD